MKFEYHRRGANIVPRMILQPVPEERKEALPTDVEEATYALWNALMTVEIVTQMSLDYYVNDAASQLFTGNRRFSTTMLEDFQEECGRAGMRCAELAVQYRKQFGKAALHAFEESTGIKMYNLIKAYRFIKTGGL